MSLKKTSLGIDIADRTIEVVVLEKNSSACAVQAKFRLDLAAGLVLNGRIVDASGLAQIIKDAMHSSGIRAKGHDAIFFGLPEKQIYTHVWKTAKKKNHDYKPEMEKELAALVPLEPALRTSEYTVINETADKVTVLSITAERGLLKMWNDFFRTVGLEHVQIGSDTLATYFGLMLPKNEKLPTVVADIGGAITAVGIFDADGMKFSFSFDIAGDRLNEMIAQKTSLPLTEAEKEKIEHGFTGQNLGVDEALQAGLDEIVANVKDGIAFAEREHGITIPYAILVGGNSQVPGLKSVFADKLGLPVRLGATPLINDGTSILFLEAAGLAYVGLNDETRKHFPVFQMANFNAPEPKPQPAKTDPIPEKLTPEPDDAAADAAEANEAKARFHKQLITLGIVLFIGIIALGLAFWYRSYAREQQKSAQITTPLAIPKPSPIPKTPPPPIKLTVTTTLDTVQTFTVTVPITVRLIHDRIQGKLTEQNGAGVQMTEMTAVSFAKTGRETHPGETVWPIPLLATSTIHTEIIDSAEQKIINAFITWLAYDEAQAKKLLAQKVESGLTQAGIPFMLDTIEPTDLRPSNDLNIYLLVGNVTARLSQTVDPQLIERE